MKKNLIRKIVSGVLLSAAAGMLLTGCGDTAKVAENVSAETVAEGAETEVSEEAEASETASGLPEKLTIGCMPDWPPFDYVDAEGNITGYDVAVTLEACKRLGIDGEFVAYEWDGLLPALESGRVQMVAAQIYRSEEREEKFNFSNSPYFKNDVNMIVKADATAASVQDVIDQNLTFTVVAGELNEKFLKDNGINYVYVEGSPQTQVDDILAGHSDGFLSMWDTINYILKNAGKEGALKSIGDPLATDYVYAVFQKTDEGAALAKAFSEVYLEMEADGTLTKFSEEYLSGVPVEGLSAGNK